MRTSFALHSLFDFVKRFLVNAAGKVNAGFAKWRHATFGFPFPLRLLYHDYPNFLNNNSKLLDK